MRTLFFSAAFVVSLTASAQKEAMEKRDMASFIETYNADLDDLNKVYGFKDSPEYFERFKRYYHEALQALRSLPFHSLPVSEQVDYTLLKRNISRAKEDLQAAEMRYGQISHTVPFADKIISLQTARRRGKSMNPTEAASIINSVKNEVAAVRARMEKAPPMAAPLARRAGEAIEGLRRGLQNTVSFYNAYDPLFTWWVKKPYEEADTALALYATFIKAKTAKDTAAKDDGSGIVGSPIGAEALKELLQYEMIPYAAEELVEIANREFAWCDAEMLKASKEAGFGTNWKAALEKMKEHYVEPGRQPELVNTLAEEAIAFIEKNRLVTIPPLAKEAWRMFMLTEAQQRLAPFFLGGESILVGYPTSNMDHDTKLMSMRSNNYAFSHATVFHELIPGHNLQYFMSRRYKPYRSLFRTPFSVEGWALYWEMLLWDKGFDDTPEKKIGALFWRMHRCARIIFSLNYHLGKWTPKQCIDFLVERVGHERYSAEGEVRRSFTGGYGPLYQVAYMMGGLQLRALYKEVVVGGKMAERDFHDRFLQENSIPLEMFRAIVTNTKLNEDFKTSTKLNEDFKTSWRFADAKK